MSRTRPLVIPLNTRRATLHLARALAQCLQPSDLVILSGELGAGKTFLVRGVSRALGLPEHVRVTSPTFSLVHELSMSMMVLHADLYRLQSASDVRELGLVQRRDEGCVLLVEWGERWLGELGGDALILSLAGCPRSASLTPSGPRSEQMLAQIRKSGQRSQTLR